MPRKGNTPPEGMGTGRGWTDGTQARDHEQFQWDEEATITEVKRSDNTVYRVGYAKKGKREYVTIRYWYYHEDSHEWRPTRNGMNLDLELATDIIDAMITASQWGLDR
jgi:hypothetical protein